MDYLKNFVKINKINILSFDHEFYKKKFNSFKACLSKNSN